MKAENHKSQPISRRGFTLYYAMLFGSVMLAIGASLLNISLKELRLSSALNESEYAFYAADSGIECALYWDSNANNIFPTYRDSSGNYRVYLGTWQNSPPPPVSNSDPIVVTSPFPVRCNGDVAVQAGWPYQAYGDYGYRSLITANTSAATTTFYYNVSSASGKLYCTVVEIGKSIQPNRRINTYIDSRGYNLACDKLNDSRSVERAFTTHY